METKFEEIKEMKIKEVTEFFSKFNILPSNINEEYIHNDFVEFLEDETHKKDETKFYWTRLSINSNVGYVID
jgi:hypothetical protein